MSQTQLKETLVSTFREVSRVSRQLAGDVVLVPDPDNIEAVTRDTLEKIAHWSDMTEADIPRLGILTDSFFRFIDEGEDASVVTLWREGTPVIQQISGEPCEAALDLVQDAIAGQVGMKEKWAGLPPLEAEIEKLAYQKGFVAGHRPKWLERRAREILAGHGIDTDEPPTAPVAANDNVPPRGMYNLGDAQRMLRQHFEGGHIRLDGDTRRHFLADCWYDGKIGVGLIGDDGEPLFQAHANQPRPPVKATPFVLRDPASLPERDWLFGKHYIRKYATASVGPGGGGKTAHSISETLAMVTGRPLLDPDGPLTKPLRVWWINAEDPQPEIDRRFHAAAKHFDVTEDQIGGRLFTDSGRDQEFVIARTEGRDLKVVEPFVAEMVAEIKLREIDVVIVDPFVSTHEAQENDNSAMQRVTAAWVRVADDANCCVELVHHVAKNQGEVTADSARGGGAFKDKVRSMRVFNVMTDAEAAKVGVDDPRAYFRLDMGKVNMVASGRSQWRRFVSVPLGNGQGLVKTGDEIGVVESWRWPSADVLAERQTEARRAVVADVPAETLAGLKVRLENGDYKANPQGKPWAGDVVMELTGVTDKKVGKAMLDAWIESGELEIVDIPDAYRHLKPHIKPAAAL